MQLLTRRIQRTKYIESIFLLNENYSTSAATNPSFQKNIYLKENWNLIIRLGFFSLRFFQKKAYAKVFLVFVKS